MFTTVCLMQAIVGVGAGTVYAFFHQRLATEVLAVALVVQACAVVLSLVTITPHWRGLYDFRTVWTTLSFSIPIVPLQISTFVLSASDRFVILRDLGPGPTGRYQVAYTLGAVGISMLTFLNLAWLPRIFAIKDPHHRAAVLAHSRDGLYRLLVPVTLGIALGGPVALRIWAPASFHTDSLVLVILLVVTSTIPVCTAFVHSRLMLAEGRSGIVAIVTVVAALTNIALNLAMVPHLKIYGSALATLITYAALAIGMASISRLMFATAPPAVAALGAVGRRGGAHLRQRSHPDPRRGRRSRGSSGWSSSSGWRSGSCGCCRRAARPRSGRRPLRSDHPGCGPTRMVCGPAACGVPWRGDPRSICRCVDLSIGRWPVRGRGLDDRARALPSWVTRSCGTRRESSRHARNAEGCAPDVARDRTVQQAGDLDRRRRGALDRTP